MVEAFVEEKDECVVLVLKRVLQCLYDLVDIRNSLPGCQSMHMVDSVLMDRMMDGYSHEVYMEDCPGLCIEGRSVLIYIWDFVCNGGQYSVHRCLADI